MDNFNDQKKSITKVVWAIVLVAVLVFAVLYMVFGFNWTTSSNSMDEVNNYIRTGEFKGFVEEVVASRDLSSCEEFQEDAVVVACLLEGVTESWVLHADENVCSAVSQRVFSSPLNFGGDYIYDFNGACVTFLSVKSMQDFCDKTLNEVSRGSCLNILQERNELYEEAVRRSS